MKPGHNVWFIAVFFHDNGSRQLSGAWECNRYYCPAFWRLLSKLNVVWRIQKVGNRGKLKWFQPMGLWKYGVIIK
jgi:hypothetical protein